MVIQLTLVSQSRPMPWRNNRLHVQVHNTETNCIVCFIMGACTFSYKYQSKAKCHQEHFSYSACREVGVNH